MPHWKAAPIRRPGTTSKPTPRLGKTRGAVPAGQEEAVRRGLAVHEIGPRRRRRRARAEERETEAEALRDAERARDLRVRSELDVVADAREIARRVGQRLGRGVPCGLDARKACMMHAQVRLNRHARVLPGEARRVEEGGQRIARARDPCPAATELLGAVVRKLGHVRRPCFARRDEGTHDHEADEVPGRARGPREPCLEGRSSLAHRGGLERGLAFFDVHRELHALHAVTRHERVAVLL
jgi:hypothetical protein